MPIVLARTCKRCNADITERHRLATVCFDCLYGRKPGDTERRREQVSARLAQKARA